MSHVTRTRDLVYSCAKDRTDRRYIIYQLPTIHLPSYLPRRIREDIKGHSIMYLDQFFAIILSTDYSHRVGYTIHSSSLLVSTYPRTQHTCSVRLCFLIRLPTSAQPRHKTPAGAVILGHLGRSVKGYWSDGIHCDYYDYDTEVRVKVRTLHHKVN